MNKRGNNQRIFYPNLFLKNRKGVSGIIFTIIMIVLVLAAVGIVWGVIQNIISESTEDISLAGLTIDVKIKSVKVEGENILVNIIRNSGKGDLTGLKFIFFDGKNSEEIGREVSLKELEGMLFNFTLNELNVSEIETVSVAPVYLSISGKEIVGEITHIGSIGLGGGGSGPSPPSPPSSPTVTLNANPLTIPSGSNSDLNWATTNTDSCIASGVWSGTKATSGSETVGPLNSNSTFTLSCTGPGGSSSDSVIVTVTSGTAPILSNGNPSGNLSAGTTQTTISLTTNVPATCRYSTSSGVTYSSMTNTFSTTGGTTHSQLITGLIDGTSYNYYVRCQDGSGNTNTNDFTISFSVDTGLPPVCPNGLIELGEQCDDDNTNNNDNCIIDPGNNYECKFAFCSDGYLWNESGGIEQCDDGNSVSGDGCSSLCQIEAPLENTGIVGLTWPPGINLFFDSDNLSKTVSYVGKFAKFPGSAETRCLPVTDHIFPSEPAIYNKSFVRLGTPFNTKTDISTGDNYEIWNFPGCGA